MTQRRTPATCLIVVGWLALLCSGCRQGAPATRDADELQDQVRRVRQGLSDSVHVTRQRVTDADLSRLGELSALRELLLDGGQVTDRGILAMGDMPRLEHVRIRGGRIGDEGLERLKQLQTLRIVNLPDAVFTDRGLALLVPLPRLEQLRFGSPHVTDEGMRHVAAMPALRFLHLIDVPISDRGLEELESMSQLESLYLDGTMASDEGIESLLTALPELHLHVDQTHRDRQTE